MSRLILISSIALGLVGYASSAETLRVTSWNLGISSQTQDAGPVIEQAAATLSSLAPDVILLQGIQDWRMSEQLAGLLRPAGYRVLICSSSRGGPLAQEDQTQVAVLAKKRAYFTWSEAWQPQKEQPLPRGVAFAAIQAGTQSLGFFSALSGGDQSTDELATRILGEIDAVGHWETNRVQTFVVGTSFDPRLRQSAKAASRTATLFDRAGLVDATEELPQGFKATLRPGGPWAGGVSDSVFTGPMGFPTDTRITATPFVEHYPITFELELDPNKVTLALDIRADKRREQQARVEELAQKTGYWVGIGVAGSVVLGLVVVWLAKRRSRIPPRAQTALPVRATPKVALPARPPILLSETAVKPAKVTARLLQQPPRPVLRLQSSSRPAMQPPPLPLAPATVEALEPREETEPPLPAPMHPPEIPAVASLHEPDVRRGVIKELSDWLKHKLVRRLVSDRTQLMHAQHLATRMASTLDNRLAKIETQIQQQNQAYVRRIEELNKELAAAREENRELIRERIAQVRAEMEEARARMLAEAHLDNSSLRL